MSDLSKYQEYNGTFYHKTTSENMMLLLEHHRIYKTRLRFHWGDVKTGKDWGDDLDVCGRIGRSTGPIKIPILLHNRRSTGGGGILDHCIVKITTTKGKRVLYQHPKYNI
jgi:hypothetical protein